MKSMKTEIMELVFWDFNAETKHATKLLFYLCFTYVFFYLCFKRALFSKTTTTLAQCKTHS